jgi:hypothetical protein
MVKSTLSITMEKIGARGAVFAGVPAVPSRSVPIAR